MPLKHTFRQHRKLCEKYLSALETKQKAFWQLYMKPYPGQWQIDLLKEQIEIFRNLEYIGTPDGKAPATQLHLFV
ncbi:hypothetical protein [Spirosoma areae]